MESDRTGPKVNVLNWGMADIGGIRQELSKVNWVLRLVPIEYQYRRLSKGDRKRGNMFYEMFSWM